MSQHIGETGEAPEHPHTAGARLSAKASVGTGGPFLRRRGDDWPAAREAKVFSLAQTHARASDTKLPRRGCPIFGAGEHPAIGVDPPFTQHLPRSAWSFPFGMTVNTLSTFASKKLSQ